MRRAFFMKKTRGYRNNNPLNIERNATRWQGMAENQNDSRFIVFKSMAYGYRAAIRTLVTYFTVHRLRSIRQIVNRWAPPVENHTDNYIKTVSQHTGFHPDAELDLLSQDTMCAVVAAMSYMENGIEPSMAEIRQGFLLAFAD